MVQHASKSEPVSPRSMPKALILSALSIIAAIFIGVVASNLSREDLERRYHQFYLRDAHLLRTMVQLHDHMSDAEALETISEAWEVLKPHISDEYICVVNSQGRLVLHTAAPQTVGNYCGQNRLVPTTGFPASNLEQLLKINKDYVGGYISSAGQDQIAAFVSLPARGWILGVHRSRELFRQEIDTSFLFLKGAFWLVCGVLMPLSLYLVYRSIAADRRHILQTETALRQSEERLRSVLENADDGFFQTTPEGRFLEANPAMARMLGFETREELLQSASNAAFQYFVESSRREQFFESLKKRGQLLGFDCKLHRQDGSMVWASINARQVKEAYGKVIYIEGFARDVTANRESTERIKEALTEKEVLLREIHHRVKNNMQVISSMLNLQSAKIKSPEVLDLMRDSQNRVRAMSLIHESLYQSDNLADIDLQSYVSLLASGLLVAYDMRSSGFGLQVKAEGVRLGVDQAIPCGLILNELISNSLKHAFLQGGDGELLIKAWNDDGEVGLEVKDNGVGLPPGFVVDANGSGLGLSLVKGLAENQLQGDFQLESNGGVRVLIHFPAREQPAPAGD
jgi:PAS domain S-box-containing protein